MRAPVFVYDPTGQDSKSRVRGIGRYLQILRENAPADWTFITSLGRIPSHSILIQPFYTFYSPPLIGKRITDRQIAVIHDLIPFKYPSHFPIGIRAWLYSLMAKNNLKLFDEVITDSTVSKSDIHSLLKIPENRISVLYPTLADCFWNAKPASAPGEYCLYVGDGTWNKNLSTLARALKQTSLTCLFVGKIFEDTNPAHYTHPWQEDLGEFFREAEGHKQFIFTGYVSDTELVSLYSKAAYNISLSHDEGFGFSFVEAAACGCPSLLSDRPIFHEIAGEAAQFVDNEDAGAIAKKLTLLMNDREKRTEMSFKALERSKEYNRESFKSRLIQIAYPY